RLVDPRRQTRKLNFPIVTGIGLEVEAANSGEAVFDVNSHVGGDHGLGVRCDCQSYSARTSATVDRLRRLWTGGGRGTDLGARIRAEKACGTGENYEGERRAHHKSVQARIKFESAKEFSFRKQKVPTRPPSRQ